MDLTQCRILVVDDEPPNVRLLERMLSDAGYRQVRSTTEPWQVRALYDEFHPDLILLDLMMPRLDGISVIRQLEIPADVFLPILVLTADTSVAAKKRALEAGAQDFLTKPLNRLEVLLREFRFGPVRELVRQTAISERISLLEGVDPGSGDREIAARPPVV